MHVVRLLSATALIAIVLVTFVTPPSSAAGQTTQAKVTWGIVTGTLYLNKKETLKLSLGAGAATTLGSFLPPPFDIVVVVMAGTLTLWSGWAVADGKCIKIKSYGSVAIYGPKDRNGKWCR